MCYCFRGSEIQRVDLCKTCFYRANIFTCSCIFISLLWHRDQEVKCIYSKTCLQGTLRRGNNLWSGDTFSKRCPIFPMLRNLWWRDTCHVGTLSLGYWGVPWTQVLLYRVYPIRSMAPKRNTPSPLFNSYVPLTKSLKLLYLTIKYATFCTDLLQ